MEYNKPTLSFNEQIEKLKNRGMHFENEQSALDYLSKISYYKLSGYWFTFYTEPHENHIFKPNTSFNLALETYIFDRKLRILLFDQIERIENAFKTQLIYNYSMDFDKFWFNDEKLFKSNKVYIEFQDLLNSVLKDSKEVFITHFKNKYNESVYPPAWMTLDILSLGQVSRLYKNLKVNKTKKQVAKFFGIDSIVLESWLETITIVRNMCAHHSRLWNRKLNKSPIIANNTANIWVKALPDNDKQQRIFLPISIILYLSRIVNQNTTFLNKLNLLFNEYPRIPLHYMGFPKDWKTDEFWQN